MRTNPQGNCLRRRITKRINSLSIQRWCMVVVIFQSCRDIKMHVQVLFTIAATKQKKI